MKRLIITIILGLTFLSCDHLTDDYWNDGYNPTPGCCREVYIDTIDPENCLMDYDYTLLQDERNCISSKYTFRKIVDMSFCL